MTVISSFDTWLQFALTCGVIAGAQAVYVVYGFGVGMVALGLLGLLLPELTDAVVILMLVSLPIEVVIAARGMGRTVTAPLLLVASGLLVATPLGALVLKTGRGDVLYGTLGGLFIVTGLFLGRGTRRRIVWPAWSRPLAGALSGFLSGAFGVGGPPLIAFFQLEGMEKRNFRDGLIALFLLTTLVRIPSYAAGGLFTERRLTSSLLVFPAAILGAWVGSTLHRRITETAFRRGVGILVTALGILTIVLKT